MANSQIVPPLLTWVGVIQLPRRHRWTAQQGFGFGAGGRVVVALLVELGLHRVKESTIEDGGLLAGQYLALEDDLANVEPIAQKMGERAAGERVSPLFVSALTNFGMPADAWTANLSSTGLQQSVKCWRK